MNVQRNLRDHRTERQRQSAFESGTGDVELDAANVIARLTGAQVTLQDDNSSPGMPDIRIEYASGRTGAAEVVIDMTKGYGSLYAEALPRRSSQGALNLNNKWFVKVGHGAKLKVLRRELAPLLEELERTQDVRQYVRPFRSSDVWTDPTASKVERLRVIWLFPAPADSGQLVLTPAGASGPVGLDWPGFCNWIEEFLFAEGRSDVRSKLAASDCRERHAFVFASYTSPWAAFHALSDDWRDLPTEPPHLPEEVTHLWTWTTPPTGRCLAWFPDRGWFEPRYHWATE
jgi:hypothetical protein